MKIYVISLERATERRNFISSHLRACGADYEIIDAIDYTRMSDEELISQCDGAALKSAYPTRGMYACALSHVRAYKRLLADGLERALIIEDDAVLPLKINGILRLIDQRSTDDEVILLSYYSYKPGPLRFSKTATRALGDGLELATPVEIDSVVSAMAYVISSRVAARMIEIATPVSKTADSWAHFYKMGAFRTLRCLYPLQVRAQMFVSTIDYPEGSTWMFKAKSFIRKYSFLESLFRSREAIRESQKYSYEFTDELSFDVTPPQESRMGHNLAPR